MLLDVDLVLMFKIWKLSFPGFNVSLLNDSAKFKLLNLRIESLPII